MINYETYKKSDFAGIGEVPAHWEVKRLKHLGEAIIGLTYSPNDVIENEEGILVLRSSNIQEGIISFDDCVYVNKDVNPNLITQKGDILICARNGSAHLVGKNICIDENSAGNTFGAFMVVFRGKYWRYLSYFFNSPIFSSQTGMFSTTTINQLTSQTLNNLRIAYPSNEFEQELICNYLDLQTQKIDRLITNKKAQADKLKELRQIEINNAVTKGLNPDAELKDSGIDWLGEIPKHWEVKRLKNVADIKYGLGQPPEEKEDGLPLIRATNVERGKINETDLIFVDPSDVPYDRDPVLMENDIIVVRSGAYTADSAIIPKKFEGAIAGYDMVMRVIKSSPLFISYCLLSNYLLVNQLFLERLRAAQPHLNKEELSKSLVVIPPFKEQLQIANYLQERTESIDILLKNIDSQIDKLQELRKIKIYEAVTGKIKVNAYAKTTS